MDLKMAFLLDGNPDPFQELFLFIECQACADDRASEHMISLPKPQWHRLFRDCGQVRHAFTKKPILMTLTW